MYAYILYNTNLTQYVYISYVDKITKAHWNKKCKFYRLKCKIYRKKCKIYDKSVNFTDKSVNYTKKCTSF